MLMRKQGGYSLIEVTLFLAISSMLAIMAIAGFSNTRGQAQFSDSVERLTQQVLERRQEALSTVKLSGGTDANNVTFGRLLTFTPNSSTVQVQTLVTSSNSAPTNGQAVVVNNAETTSFDMAWGVTYTGNQPMQVAFTRSTVDGVLQTTAWNGLDNNLTYSDFTPPANVATTFSVNVIDPNSRRAHLVIDPAKNGVTRVYP
jgi:type II secretory pathway pseudopilin PulG